jgi:hypothetical protein
MDGDEHFAETRLAEVVGQYLDVPPSHILALGNGRR